MSKWLAEQLGKNPSTVFNLATRYEKTLGEMTASVADYEKEVNGYLKEMGFTL